MAQTDPSYDTNPKSWSFRIYPLLILVCILGWMAKLVVTLATHEPLIDTAFGALAGLSTLTLIIYLSERKER